jgi:hypothetical protein
MSDPLEELKTMLQESIVANKAMHESTASRMASDARAHVEQVATMRAELNGKIEALSGGLTTLHNEIVVVKKTADGARSTADAAMKSYDDIQLSSQEQWRSVTASQGAILTGLEQQNRALAERDAAKKLERQRESEHAERMATEKEAAAAAAAAKDKVDAEAAAAKAKVDAEAAAAKAKADAEERERVRSHSEAKQRIWAPVWQAIFVAAVTSGVGYAAVRLAHQDTDAKIDANSRQTAAVANRVETVARAVATPEPSYTPAPASSRPAPVTK